MKSLHWGLSNMQACNLSLSKGGPDCAGLTGKAQDLIFNHQSESLCKVWTACFVDRLPWQWRDKSVRRVHRLEPWQPALREPGRGGEVKGLFAATFFILLPQKGLHKLTFKNLKRSDPRTKFPPPVRNQLQLGERERKKPIQMCWHVL